MYSLSKKLYKLLNFTYFKLLSIILFCVFVAIFQVLSSVYVSVLVDKFIDTKSVFISETMIFFTILLIYTVFKIFLRYFFNVISLKSEYNLHKKCIENIGFMNKDIIIVLNRVGKLRGYFDDSLESIFYIPILFIATFIGAYYLDPMICIFILPFIFISVLIDIKLSPILLSSSKEYYDLEKDLFKFQKNVIENKEQIVLKNIENFVVDKHSKIQEEFLNASNKLTKSEQISYTPALLNEYMPTIVLIFISSIKAYYFGLSYGKFMGLLGLIVGVSLPFTKFLRVLISLKSLTFVIDDLSEVSKRNKNFNFESNTNIKDLDFDNIIFIENLNFKYEESTKFILKNINFTLKNKNKVAIIGETGSGKTTFLKLILGLLESDGFSTIKIFGLDINMNYKSIWNEIGYVDNNNYLFNRSIIYNITFKEELSDVELKHLEDIAEKLNILDLVEKNIILEEFGNNLSGGQKLKICIARALFKRPKLLILDEPTASFDENSELIFTDVLRKLDISALVVTHRKGLYSICDEVYELKNGKLVEFNYE